MTVEFQFNSVTIQAGEIEETYPLMFSALQPYLPVQKPIRRRKPRKKRQTVASLIDAVIENINRGSGG